MADKGSLKFLLAHDSLFMQYALVLLSHLLCLFKVNQTLLLSLSIGTVLHTGGCSKVPQGGQLIMVT